MARIACRIERDISSRPVDSPWPGHQFPTRQRQSGGARLARQFEGRSDPALPERRHRQKQSSKFRPCTSQSWRMTSDVKCGPASFPSGLGA